MTISRSPDLRATLPVPRRTSAPGRRAPDGRRAVGADDLLGRGTARSLAELVSTVISGHGDELARAFHRRLFVLAPDLRGLYPVNLTEARQRFLSTILRTVRLAGDPDDLASVLRQHVRDHPPAGCLVDRGREVRRALLGAFDDVAVGGRASEDLRRGLADVHAHSWPVLETAVAARGPIGSGEVVHHVRLGPDLAIVHVRVTPAPVMRAGQYVAVEVPQRPGWWRRLSPAGVPGSDGVVEFHVRAVPGGWVSPVIVAHTGPGDRWRIGPPAGHLTVEPVGERGLLLVAGGTGIAPALAIVEELTRHRSERRVGVFYGGRRVDDLYALARLRELARVHCGVTVLPVVESPAGVEDDDAAVQLGTLADVVPRFGAWPDREVVLSGPPAMLRTTVNAMLATGTPLSQLHHDDLGVV